MNKSPYIPPEDWTPEQIQAKLQNLINHVERLKGHWNDKDLKAWANPSYSRFTLDGSSTPIFPYLDCCKEAVEDEDVEQLGDNPYVLAEEQVSLFYGADLDGKVSTVGGFPCSIEGCHYTPCPDCGKPMKLVARLSWEMLDFMEGNCYVEVCPECRVASMHHLQT